MTRITPRTCLWPLVGCIIATFILSIGLTYRSDHHCFAGTCGEWLFPLQARLHVVVWYMWISLSVALLAVRAFQPSIRSFVSKPLGLRVPLVEKELRISGVLLILWMCSLYGILIGIWWPRLRDYFETRGAGLPGDGLLAAIALTGHVADVTMGMVLLPVSRHSAIASFMKIAPSTTLTFHITQAYVLFTMVTVHGSLYAAWAALYNKQPNVFRPVYPVLNPTYLYHEVWPGSTSALGIWRASLIFSGTVASLIMVALLLTSFPTIRRKHFNLFYFTHILAIVAVVIICLHASTMFYCTVPGLGMWLLDWSLRLHELREKLPSSLKSLGNGCLTAPLPRKRLQGCACHSPLAHFYIHHSESSVREIHPFTTITHLASAKRDSEGIIQIRFLFRQIAARDKRGVLFKPSTTKVKQWTQRLASIVDEQSTQERGDGVQQELEHLSKGREADVGLRLEGPYFTPATPETYGTIVCLVAGTGLTGALAIAAAFSARARASTITSTVSQDDKSLKTVSGPGHNRRCIVVWVVKEKDYVDLPFLTELACEGLDFRIHKTGGTNPRPDMNKVVSDICGEDGPNSWCYISGPGGFITGAEQACSRVKGLTWFAARWD